MHTTVDNDIQNLQLKYTIDKMKQELRNMLRCCYRELRNVLRCCYQVMADETMSPRLPDVMDNSLASDIFSSTR